MRNVTIVIDDKYLEACREYARAHNTTLNALIRELLERYVLAEQETGWVETFFKTADSAQGNSRGKHWRREDLYDV